MKGHSTLALITMLPIRADRITFLRNHFELLQQLEVPEMTQIKIKINMTKLTYIAIHSALDKWILGLPLSSFQTSITYETLVSK